ncbi:hypothetical protein [Streptosporangium roseum]|uniref:hypothetical protein n=1 Tax=Streptosporangium roseum TaxID=2001 RepID=UPI0033344200
MAGPLPLAAMSAGGLRIVLALQETPGARIKASDILLLGQVPGAFQVARTIEIVELAGMLDDDRISAIVTWFDTKITDLPGPMQEELRLWFEVMRHGSTTPTRRRPRNEGTIRMKLSRALPALHRWAGQHTSLREISKDDVLAVLPASRTTRGVSGPGRAAGDSLWSCGAPGPCVKGLQERCVGPQV